MTTTVIRVTCPDCGTVDAPLAVCVVTVVDRRPRATYPCPRCTVPASLPINAIQVAALIEERVPFVCLPDREEPSGRGRITQSELNRFIVALHNTDLLAAAA